MNFFLNLVKLDDFHLAMFKSYVQEQVKSGECNSVTHGSGVPFSLNNGKCPEIP